MQVPLPSSDVERTLIVLRPAPTRVAALTAAGYSVIGLNIAANDRPGTLRQLRQVLIRERFAAIHVFGRTAAEILAIARLGIAIPIAITESADEAPHAKLLARQWHRLCVRRMRPLNLNWGLPDELPTPTASADNRSIVVVGTMDSFPEWEWQVRAFNSLRFAEPNGSIQWIGTGKIRTRLQTYYRQVMQFDAPCEWLSDRPDLPERMANARLVWVMDRRSRATALGILAAKIGVPVLATLGSDLCRRLPMFPDDRLIPWGGVAELARASRRIFQTDPSTDSESFRLAESVRAEFPWQALAESLSTGYHQLATADLSAASSASTSL
ncbi:unnamed protein product [Tuwongella immobilis]|uniref:Glycosyl transferase family 1 domain-containing protein n=1 Tax=Tuwongella immobilis TaxID=692036 RepID=A0A6C2YLE9_9BACT|nr:unnamed protein product [Tuwongella immobilis]VTS00699.1 unnamed protein product [Tuwongella immobilis]